ncbi:MAG: methyltransferase domain-containing protein [Cryobacterium sp.]|nr:methyltransferase domain-containing protein [Oligoflexia bacterium]
MKKSLVGDGWQERMYDDVFAERTIDSPEYHQLARREVEFLSLALNLRKGEKLLDVPCGTGRHSRIFSRRGVEVTGLDLSKELIARAKRNSGPLFRVGNMIDLAAYRNQFDVVTNLFTSFGYFSSESKNLKVMREMVNALKPGGRIAIHLVNREWLLNVFQPFEWRETKKDVWTEHRTYDDRSKRIKSHSVYAIKATGRAHFYEHETRLYSKKEIIEMMAKCGLRNITVYGDMEGSLFRRFESSHPIYIGWKAEG